MADADTLYFVFYVIAGVFIVAMMAKMGVDWGSGKALQRDYLVLDTALLLDTAYAVPGDVDMNYIVRQYRTDLVSKGIDYVRSTKKDYNLSIKNYEVRTIPVVGHQSWMDFVRDNNTEFKEIGIDILTDFDSPLNIRKDSIGIRFNEYLTGEGPDILCPKVDTKNEEWQEGLLIFDGNQDTKGLINGLMVELEVSGKDNARYIGDETGSSEEKARLYSDADIMLATYYGDDSKSNIYVFSNSDIKSKKLACLIANAIRGQKNKIKLLDDVEYSLIIKGTASDEFIDVIKTNNVGVFLELNLPKLSATEVSILRVAIADAVEKYYT